MNQLSNACQHIINQLEDVVHQIHDQDFSRPCASLHATVGQHLRHTIEFFICLEDGFEKGVVNYDKRNHDHLIESDKFIASCALKRINTFIGNHHEEKILTLEVGYEKGVEHWITIETNYQRELIYNIEHAVHHMAIMKIGLREVAPYIEFPADFGVAVSTLRFRESQVEQVG